MSARPVIVFSHANGFPAGTYRQLFEVWRDAGFDVRALDKIGHDERYPVSLNWPHLRDQLVDFIEAKAAAPVWLVGHSLGGFLSVLAAAERPDLARGIVLLDSPLLPPMLGRAWQFAQLTGIGERFTPGAVSKRRRQNWSNAVHALQHFAGKKAFARWAPGVLQDYVDAGMEAEADGLRLGFDREIETAIYNTLPNHIARLLRRKPLQCPVAFIAGSESAEVKQVGLKMTRQVCAGRISWLEGSHLFPFERPAETAAAVLGWLHEFGAQPAAGGSTRRL
ncbi:alpha/beta hydrolase [Piscinibacter sakaiensis]|uniref:alpha/beta hydrolase n=1 Tax=Piscinibacter sakaiensis TaxID=1547922 RepID=UPI003AAAA4A9